MPGSRGEFTLRTEFMYQWSVGHPPEAAGTSGGGGGGGDHDLRSAIAAEDGGAEGSGRHFGTSIGTLLIGYTVPF